MPLSASLQGGLGHLLAGMISIFAGSIVAVIFENQKTTLQIQNPLQASDSLFNRRTLFKNLKKGTLISFVRSSAHKFGRMLSYDLFEERLFKNALGIKLPSIAQGIAGATLGTVIAYPFDLHRARQINSPSGVVRFGVSKDSNWMTFVQDLYKAGGKWALGYEITVVFLSNGIRDLLMANMALKPLLVTLSLDPKVHQRINWFVGQAVSRILLTPLEHKKKREQVEFENVLDIKKNESWSSLYKGWYFSIPETFSDIILTSAIYSALIKLFSTL